MSNFNGGKGRYLPPHHVIVAPPPPKRYLHLCFDHQVTTATPSAIHLVKLLFSLGVTPYGAPTTPHATPLLPVILDGRIIGEVESGLMQEFSVKLRTLKAMGKEKVFSLEQVQWLV